MASSFTPLTNNKSSFDADTNPDFNVKTTTLAKDGDCVVEHVRLDFGTGDEERQTTIDDPFPVQATHSIKGILDGRKTVTTAGAREALVATSTPCKKVDITALSSNKGTVVIGGITCVAAVATRSGTPLVANQGYSLEISDLNLIYLDVTTSGEGVSFTYFT